MRRSIRLAYEKFRIESFVRRTNFPLCGRKAQRVPLYACQRFILLILFAEDNASSSSCVVLACDETAFSVDVLDIILNAVS